MQVDKSKMKADNGVPLTQGLFLEIGYPESAMYTTKDEDYEYKGSVLPSIKKLYLEMEDVVEYEFATTYFLGWEHWQRICNNKQLKTHIDQWRYELELKLRSRAFKEIKRKATLETGISAAKWLADKGWDKHTVGRPSKEAVERETKLQSEILGQYQEDASRIYGGH